ncbi:MAG: SusC/RagA family TonB-linked outer membrane protein [Bacteroidales bacterium]|nr:SusC/RagA family TonB-linked outer membrane protein [Bacteroidales bacterium]MCF8458001.1 SusC/RagA family TonB-linked outer membrane protein [Bacteroidales bacterium]
MKQLFTLFILMAITFMLSAQVKTISGTVTSLEDGEPLPYVSVFIKGTTKGVSTDLDGNYKITDVKSSDIIVFSFIGLETKSIEVKTQTVINVELGPTANKLNEVVVTALGINRQQKEIGYSTQKVSGEDIEKSNASNVMSALAGKTAGIQISDANGVEGGTTRIVIRGNNNINTNNQPLIVVDGMPLENQPGLEDIGRGTDWGSAINNIVSSDVASINILKGGAASALYGSRGANGVVLITTKKGRVQKGIGVTYNYTNKIVTPYRYRDVQNEYGGGGPISFTPPKLYKDTAGSEMVDFLNDHFGDIGGLHPRFTSYVFNSMYETSALILDTAGSVGDSHEEFGYYGSGASWGPRMNGEPIKWWNGEMTTWSPQPDNMKMPFQNGSSVTHNIAVEGGNEIATARFSLTRNDLKPIIENSSSNQTTVNTNLLVNVSKKIKVNMVASYIDFHRLNSPGLGDDESSFTKGFVYSWPRSYQGADRTGYMNPDGTRNEQNGFPYLYISPTLWWGIFENNTTLDRSKILGTISLSYDVAPWLKFMGRTGLDFGLDQSETRNSPTDSTYLTGLGYAKSLSENRGNNSDFLFTAYRDNIFASPFNVSFNFGGNTWSQNNYYLQGSKGGSYYPNMYSFSNYVPSWSSTPSATQPNDIRAEEKVWRKKINSVYSFLNISYNDYLFLDITGRNDWSSTLPSDANSYFYPSISVSFFPTQAFNFESAWLSHWKIRGGIAQSAIDADPYESGFSFDSSFLGGDQAVSYPNKIPAVGLKPQMTNAYEAGTEVEFLNGRITFDFTYYYSYSFDQIIESPIAQSVGAEFMTINNGAISNKGVEIILNTVPIRTNDFVFRTGVNFAKNSNKIESLGIVESVEIGKIWGGNGPNMMVKEGESYGTIYGWDYDYYEEYDGQALPIGYNYHDNLNEIPEGYFPIEGFNPDDYVKGPPMVNEEGTKFLITENRVPIGNASPKFIGGWYTEFKYKNLTLGTLVDAKIGGQIYSGTYVEAMSLGQSPATLLERNGSGLPYTDPDGNESNIGVTLGGVYENGESNDKVVHYYYKYLPNLGGWGNFISTPGVLENSWVKLREVALSYTLPPQIKRKIKFAQELSVSFVCRDVCYLYTTLPDKINPEGIMGSGNAQGFEWGSLPGTRSFTFGINAKF